MTTSTRRFCCRPDAESLSATGSLRPLPNATKRDAPIPERELRLAREVLFMSVIYWWRRGRRTGTHQKDSLHSRAVSVSARTHTGCARNPYSVLDIGRELTKPLRMPGRRRSTKRRTSRLRPVETRATELRDISGAFAPGISSTPQFRARLSAFVKISLLYADP